MSDSPLDFDPKADDFMDAPHEFYRRLRAQAPVFLDPRHDIYFVTSYALVNEVMRDSRRFSSSVDRASMRRGGLPEEVAKIRAQGWPMAMTMSGNDALSHDLYKGLVGHFFTARNLDPIEPFVQERVADLLHALPRGEVFDFVERFAVPLPVSVIARTLGLSSYGDDQLKRWSDAFADEIGMLTSDERAIEIAQLTLDCHRAMMETCEARRSEPQHDIISHLVALRVPEALDDPSAEASALQEDSPGPTRPLNPSELLSILTQLLVAGNETTTNTLSGGMRRLAESPDLFTRLKADPVLIPRFVEECLRLESPVQGQFRKANEATELGGVAIPKGALLHVRLASANRDEAVYGPDDNQPQLEESKPAPHKAFGMGMHFCVGAMLSRLELKIAFEHLCATVEQIELGTASGDLHYHTHFHLRGLEALPILLR